MTTAPAIALRVERPPSPPDLTGSAGAPLDLAMFGPAPVPGRERAPATSAAARMRTRAGRFVRALVEVVDGNRPAIQLLRMSTDAVYDDLVDRLESLSELSTRGTNTSPMSTRVASVHVDQPDDDCAEVSARIVQGGRSRALALRFDLREGTWLCSAIRWG